MRCCGRAVIHAALFYFITRSTLISLDLIVICRCVSFFSHVAFQGDNHTEPETEVQVVGREPVAVS